MFRTVFALTLLLLFVSCEKDEGPGGQATIKGRVMVGDYKGIFPFTFNYVEYPGEEEDVYIIYGNDDNTFDDRTRTSYDGTFQFKYLNKGDYKVFVYSDDTVTVGTPDSLSGKVAILQSVNIGDKKETVIMSDFNIVKK
jgi:hypothetical protein